MSKKHAQSGKTHVISSYNKSGNEALRIVSAIFFVALTTLFPLYITNSRYAIITKQKAQFFCVTTGLAAIATLATILVSTHRLQIEDYFVKNEPKRPVSVPEWALAAFILLTFLSAIFSPWQDVVWNGFTLNGLSGRWEGFWTFLCYGLTFILIARFYKPKRLHFLMFAASAVLLSLYGILQFLGLDILYNIGFFSAVSDDLQGIRISITYITTLGNSNIVAAYSGLTSVFFAVLFMEERSRWGAAYLAASIMSFALLLISNGDAGKVGVVAAMVLLIPYWFSDRTRLGKTLATLSGWCVVYAGYNAYLSALKGGSGLYSLGEQDRNFLRSFTPQNPVLFIILAAVLLGVGMFLILILKKWPIRFMKIAGIAFLALSAVGGFLFVEIMGARLTGNSRNIIWQARELLHGRMQDNFGSNRGWVWKRGLSIIFNNPVLGSGPDTFLYALGEQLQLESVSLYGYAFDKAHNSFLQIAVCMGIPALLSYLIFLGGLFLQVVKKAFNRPLLLASTAAAISYLTQSFFQVDTPIDRPLLWVALGIMAGEIWRERVGA